MDCTFLSSESLLSIFLSIIVISILVIGCLHSAPIRNQLKASTGLSLADHLLFFVSAIYWTLSQEQDMSSENINEILDRLIQQTKPNGSGLVPDIVDTVNPSVETPPSNDSNIYYLKKIMAPRINFKSNGEMIQNSQQSNVSSLEIGEGTELPTAEESSPRTSKIVRKSFIEIEHQKETMPITRAESHAELKSGNLDNDVTSTEHPIKKELLADLNTATNSSHGEHKEHFNLLHQYPEIIIDHVTYDDDEQTNNSGNSSGAQHVQEIPQKPALRRQSGNSEENIKSAKSDPSEHFATNHYLTSEIKNLIDSIMQKKVTHDTLSRQGTESETSKQSKLLEKNLQKLPERKFMSNSGKNNYLHEPKPVQTPEIDTLSRFGNSGDNLLLRNVGNRFTKSYMHAPHVINRWEIHSRLLKTLLRTCRPNGLNHIRLIAELIDRIISNIDYRSACYDLFKY